MSPSDSLRQCSQQLYRAKDEARQLRQRNENLVHALMKVRYMAKYQDICPSTMANIDNTCARALEENFK